MSRWLALLSLLVLAACAERALDAAGGTTIVIDFAFTSSDGGSPPLVDLAKPGVADLAASSQIGVQCGDTVCKTSEICCPLSGKPVGCLPVMGMQGNVCPFNGGWRCDGPEDCEDGRVCYASDFTPDDNGSPQRTRCRPLQMVGGDFRLVCHTDTDCMPGFICVKNETTIPDAPAVSTCRWWQG